MAEISIGKSPFTIIDSGCEYVNRDKVQWEIRYFKNEDPSELFWHRDKELREAYLLWAEDKFEFQFEDQLPFGMNPNQSVWIPEERFHRVITKRPFILKVYKYNTK